MSSEFEKKEYDYKGRWVSYWHQINEVLDLKPRCVLEIGIGSQTTANYLKNKGVELTTLDIDPELKPDVVASVQQMPLPNSSADVILCAEVLEHLPFDKFEQCLMELARVSAGYVVLSLPHFGPAIKFSFKAPFIKEAHWAFKLPIPKQHQIEGGHQWEIGKRGYPLSKIKAAIKKYFIIQKEFIPFENQYHHFFILKKIQI